MQEKSDGSQMMQEVRIRKLERRDRSRIGEMVIATGKFNDMEIETALELVDEALEKGEGSGYIFVVLEEGKRNCMVQGYACYGPTPLTQGTYDLYWVVVNPEVQGKGLGRYLVSYVEEDVVKRGGRMLLIETSSQESYGSTVRFYGNAGYEQAARIKNFYRIGDDKLVFLKELSSKW